MASVDGWHVLSPSSLSITTLPQAIDFVKEIKDSGLSDVEEEPETENIESSGEKILCPPAARR